MKKRGEKQVEHQFTPTSEISARCSRKCNELFNLITSSGIESEKHGLAFFAPADAEGKVGEVFALE
jgi:hypothetical protein